MSEYSGKTEPRFHGAVSEKSHKNMSRIRAKDTAIEIKLRKALWSSGIRYRKNYKKIPGTPDIAITKYKIAVFCDSEFFHGKDWNSLVEKLKKGENADYWVAKISRNIDRDKVKDKELLCLGWKVLHFWGGDIENDIDGCLEAIQEAILERKYETKEINSEEEF